MLSHALRAKVQNTTPPAPKDPNFNQVSLLLHGDGTNGAQNNTFLDSSTNNFTVTRNGNTTQGTNTPFSQDAGAWSNHFNGTNSYFTLPTTTSLNLGTGDFTIECWCWSNSVFSTGDGLERNIIASGGTSFTTGSTRFGKDLHSGIALYSNNGTGSIVSEGNNTSFVANTWNHYAVTRIGNNFKLYRNGVSVSTNTSSGAIDLNQGGSTVIGVTGWDKQANDFWNGYISNLRVVKGTAIYTANFTPPTTPLTAVTNTSLLTCQSNNFKDNSSNNFALTVSGTPSVQPFSPFAPTAAYSTSVNGGSMYFDGTGDYLTAPANAAYTFGTGDFTLECWVNFNALVAYGTVFCTTTSYITSGNIYFGLGATNYLTVSASGTTLITASSTISLSSWNHIAVVRSGTTLTLYLNGVSVGSVTNSTNFYSDTPQIGAISGSYAINGYISNLRVIKGTAVYTSNFTPPTAPLTAITNTSLLLNGTNAGIFDNAIKNDLETVGNAQVSTSVVKYGTGSMSFDGTGDYLSFPSTPNLNLSTGNFTVECWFYQNAFVGGSYLFGISGASSAFAQAAIATNGSGAFYFLCADNATNNWISAGTGGSYTSNTWNHLAGVRNGSTFTLYLNGTSVLTYTSSATLVNTSTYNRNVIGAATSFGSQINGYIDDFRVTKGIARYTANFTPPTAAFPNS